MRVGHPGGVRMFCPCAAASDPHELRVIEAEGVGPEQVVVENKNFTYSDDTLIEFITDVEGHWEYFLRLAHCSKVLYWDDEERGDWGPGILRLRSNGMLVFGGDAADKGPGDIRLVKTLISLKKRFPKQARCFFVLKKWRCPGFSPGGVTSTKRLWGISFSSFYNILHIITIYIYITILISLVAERNAPFSLHLSISISKQLSCFLFTRWGRPGTA